MSKTKAISTKARSRMIARFLKTLCAALLVGTLATTNAVACAFHNYIPDPTPVDQMLASQSIVFARPDPGSGGELRIVRRLAGPALTDPALPVPDAMTRARLLASPGDALLMVRVAETEPWFRVAYADADYQEVIQRIVPQLPEWSREGDVGRFQFFADLLDHPSAELRRWALLELDRADYSVLRALDLSHTVSLAEVAAADDMMRPILILLAGLSGDVDAQRVIVDELAANASRDLPYLGAYVIALLEMQGTDAVGRIETTYLRDTGLPLATREKMLGAFAIISRAGDPETAATVRMTTSAVLDGEPTLAPAVARQFGFQGDWSQADAMARAARVHKFEEIADLFAVNQYVALSLQMENASQ